ncbi:uncharacterized protein BDZ99DRAFT_183378 [Mytilinidion resinicola]|uniref:AA1-like domain-containing protein n=1 Tax=Mytilinidion resinicola TaxID=574789 RepID=A0A6A6Z0L0_9PEZI|nr:uncharacterized protein BDZ99DRAFT_183378 [Mytilinidion resinicola]KAF2814702.1 hypothetical protein BDZ99DRAFT_183378 [Mytilinidion resinicola]
MSATFNMQFLAPLLALTMSILSLALPTQQTTEILSHQSGSLPLVVTDLVIFQSNPDINLMSFISFHYSDPEPSRNHTISGNCTYAVNGNTSLYMDWYEFCDSSGEYGFWYQENQILLTRSWWNWGKFPTYITGFAPSATNWTADNTTISPVGVVHSRTEPWFIPITSVIA